MADLFRLESLELLENETFADLDLEGHDILGKELYRCTFRSVKLPEVRLDKSVFEQCKFIDSDLTRVKAVGASFHGVRFEHCKLLGVELSNLAANPDVFFDECNLRYASFGGLNLRNTKLHRCQLQEASFHETSLIDASFDGSDLSSAAFSRCDLAGADFSNAVGVYFEAAQNCVKGVRIPVETAVMMAQALGMHVAGYEDANARGPKKRKAR